MRACVNVEPWRAARAISSTSRSSSGKSRSGVTNSGVLDGPFAMKQDRHVADLDRFAERELQRFEWL